MRILASVFSLGLLMSTLGLADVGEKETLHCNRLNDDGSLFPTKFSQVRIIVTNQTGQSKMLAHNSLFPSLGRIVELPLIYAGFPMADSSNRNLGKAFYLAAGMDPEQENMMAELTLEGPVSPSQEAEGTLKLGEVQSINPLVMGKYELTKVRCGTY